MNHKEKVRSALLALNKAENAAREAQVKLNEAQKVRAVAHAEAARQLHNVMGSKSVIFNGVVYQSHNGKEMTATTLEAELI